MTDHVKRGATLETDREVFYEYRGRDDGGINSVWVCDECDERLEVRNRRGQHAYVELGCPCGAASLDLRIADILDMKIDEWDTKTVHKLGRGDD